MGYRERDFYGDHVRRFRCLSGATARAESTADHRPLAGSRELRPSTGTSRPGTLRASRSRAACPCAVMPERSVHLTASPQVLPGDQLQWRHLGVGYIACDGHAEHVSAHLRLKRCATRLTTLPSQVSIGQQLQRQHLGVGHLARDGHVRHVRAARLHLSRVPPASPSSNGRFKSASTFDRDISAWDTSSAMNTHYMSVHACA